MIPEADENGTRNRLKTTVDVGAKLIPAVAAIIYTLGYAVTAKRLAEFGLATTQLVNAQYLVAGLPPFVLLAGTGAVIWSGLRYRMPAQGKSAFGVVSIVIGVGFVGLLVAELAGVVPFDEANPATYFFALLRLVLGEMALWLIVAGVRTGFFSQLAEYSRRDRDPINTWQIPLTVGLMAGGLILFGLIRTTRIHALIPQAYGGTKPTVVRLYAVGSSIPRELKPESSASDSGVLVATRPLELLFQNDKAYVVRRLSDSTHQVWSLDARVVVSVMTGKP